MEPWWSTSKIRRPSTTKIGVLRHLETGNLTLGPCGGSWRRISSATELLHRFVSLGLVFNIPFSGYRGVPHCWPRISLLARQIGQVSFHIAVMSKAWHLEVSWNGGTQNARFKMDKSWQFYQNDSKWMIWGVPPFQETSIIRWNTWHDKKLLASFVCHSFLERRSTISPKS